MGSQTPIYALPFPTGTDRVMDGDNAMQALAERVETVLNGVIFKAGRNTVNTDASGNATIAHGLGVMPRVVIGTVETTGAGTYIVLPYRASITATNIVFVVRTDTGANAANGTVTINWLVFA